MHSKDTGIIGLTNRDCPYGSSVVDDDGMMHFASRELVGASLVPPAVLVGVCDVATATNCSYVQRAPPGAAGADRRLMLGSQETAVELIWSCKLCPGHTWTGETAGVLVLIALCALLPVLAVSHLKHRIRAEQKAEQWPAAPRSNAAWALLQLGWVLTLLGVAPSLLWYAGHWWPGYSMYWVVVTVVGVTCMQMSLRMDDHQAVIVFVSLGISVLAIVAALIATYDLTVQWSRLQHRTDANDAFPTKTSFAVATLEVPSLFVDALSIAILISLAVSQIRILYPRSRELRGLRSDEPLLWLWHTSRTAFWALGVTSFISVPISLIAGSLCTESYPSEHEELSRRLILNGTLGATFLLVAALTTARVRVGVHLGFRFTHFSIRKVRMDDQHAASPLRPRTAAMPPEVHPSLDGIALSSMSLSEESCFAHVDTSTGALPCARGTDLSSSGGGTRPPATPDASSTKDDASTAKPGSLASALSTCACEPRLNDAFLVGRVGMWDDIVHGTARPCLLSDVSSPPLTVSPPPL